MAKVNKVVRIALSGGIIGWLTTKPRRALDAVIDKHNQDGSNAIYFAEHRTTNIFVAILQYLVLFLTLFLWTFGAGYMILFEKEKAH
jgi:hypothetical protein